jgi:hypothetical protein
MRAKRILPVFVLAAGGLIASPTFAQEKAPNTLPGINAKSPTQFPYLPRARARVARGAGKAARSGPFTGYSGGDMVVTQEKLYSYHRGRIPEFHAVKKGESLWRICRYYYNDPWAWPQLWAYNKSITNPHWIYPGDRIRLLASTPRSSRPRGDFAVTQMSSRRYNAGVISLRQNAFVDPLQLEASGRIIGSKHEHGMLSLMHEIYLKGKGKFRPRRGGVYTIYRVKRKLKGKAGKLGHIVEVLGSVRVKRINKQKVATGEITEALNVIKRGDRVGQLRRTFKQLPVRPARKNLTAEIVDFPYEHRAYAAQNDLVFINRGSNDGVRRGNRFLVIRRGDGNVNLYQDLRKDNKRFPYEPVAEISVLDVRKNASVGLVTKSTKELGRGELLRMRRGY